MQTLLLSHLALHALLCSACCAVTWLSSTAAVRDTETDAIGDHGSGKAISSFYSSKWRNFCLQNVICSSGNPTNLQKCLKSLNKEFWASKKAIRGEKSLRETWPPDAQCHWQSSERGKPYPGTLFKALNLMWSVIDDHSWYFSKMIDDKWLTVFRHWNTIFSS